MFESLFKISMMIVIAGLVILIIGITFDSNAISLAFKFICSGALLSLIIVLLDIAFGD